MYDNRRVRQVLLSISEPLVNTLEGDLEISLSSAGLLAPDVGREEPCSLKISLDLSIHNGKLTLQSECSVMGRSICTTRTTYLDLLPQPSEGSSSRKKVTN